LSEQIEETKQAATQGGSSGLKAAVAAAAAAGAAAMIARKALSGDSSSNGQRSHNGGSKGSSQQGGGMFGSIASGGFDAARDALGPAAEDAAAAVGKFVAENAPEIVRDRIVPRFIESFNEARST
jgi:hypothetical protein